LYVSTLKVPDEGAAADAGAEAAGVAEAAVVSPATASVPASSVPMSLLMVGCLQATEKTTEV
jgi:hypothetical protein